MNIKKKGASYSVTAEADDYIKNLSKRLSKECGYSISKGALVTELISRCIKSKATEHKLISAIVKARNKHYREQVKEWGTRYGSKLKKV